MSLLAIAALVFGGLVILLAPRQLFEGIDVNAIGSGRVAFARDLLTPAQPVAERLSAADVIALTNVICSASVV